MPQKESENFTVFLLFDHFLGRTTYGISAVTAIGRMSKIQNEATIISRYAKSATGRAWIIDPGSSSV
jgi:hypothetical protein